MFAPVQPAGCARGDLGDGASGGDGAHPQHGGGCGKGVRRATAKRGGPIAMADLLFEAGLEEIPARMIAAAEAELTERVVELLRRERLLEDEHEVHSYSTPRRLAVQVNGVLARQPDATQEMTGSSWSVAFKDGQPTAAAQAFAKKAGVEIAALKKVTTPKGEYVGATAVHRGRDAAAVLSGLLAAELARLYWPKNMYWRAQKPERFV